MRRRTAEERYRDNTRKQQRELEEYAAHEIEFADDLLFWYRIKKLDMPDDQYRAFAFFKNREYLSKPGSLSLLYQTYVRCCIELPSATRENAFDLLCFRFKMYAAALKTGGYDG
jgi:hypothetical protein